MSPSRDEQRRLFLQATGWQQAKVEMLQPDASFRRYFRLRRGAERAMLMDAPPPKESVVPFVEIARYLSSQGIHAPELRRIDTKHGFLLLEDLGDDTFTRLLAKGVDEQRLYEIAVDILLQLHQLPAVEYIDRPNYDAGLLLDEAVLFTDWYLPALRGEATSPALRESYANSWLEIVAGLPPPPPVLVLRDYHVDNLILVGELQQADCAVLDFQDALLGPAAYDLVSLLQDARRDIPHQLEEKMLDRYFQAMQLPDRETFMPWYRVLGVQRHCKVAGIFVRLCLRDGKHGYLEHIPRVIRLLQQGLEWEELAPLRSWVDSHLATLSPLPGEFDPEFTKALIQFPQ